MISKKGSFRAFDAVTAAMTPVHMQIDQTLGPKDSADPAADIVFDLHNTTANSGFLLLMAPGDDFAHMEHRSAHAHRRRQAASRGLTGGDAESRRTCPASAGEDGDHVCRPRARPRPLGEPQYDPRGLRFIRTCTLTRTAAVSRWLRGTGTAPPDGGTSTPSPLGSGTVSYTPGPAPVVRGTSTGAARDVYT